MCAVELCHIGADSARYISHYMPNVSEWYDWREENRSNFTPVNNQNWYESYCKDFERDVENKYARWIRTEAEPREHANCTYDYLLNAKSMFSELVGSSVDSIISAVCNDVDEISDQYIIDKVKNNLSVYVADDKYINILLKRHRKFVIRNKKVDTGLLRESAWSTQREYLDYQAWKRQQYDHLLNGTISNRTIANESKLLRAYRKVAKKSVQVLSAMTDRETTSAFINGDYVDIEGEFFTYRITKSALLVSPTYSSHGAINIEVIDTSTKTFLFNLCWYLDGTPPAEQFLGFMLHVKAGNEGEILRTGNTYNKNVQVPEHLRIEVNKKLSKIYDGTRKIIPFVTKNDSTASTDLDLFIGDPMIRRFPFREHIDNYHEVKEELLGTIKKYVTRNYPQFDNYAYQRNANITLTDQSMSTLTKDFKALTHERRISC